MTDKELLRHFKAEMYGRLTAMGVILLVLVCSSKCNHSKSEAVANEDALKKTSVVPVRNDSIAGQNIFMQNSRTKVR